MNEGLVKQPRFTVERANLDEKRYADSLFGEAIRLGIANDADTERFIGGVAQLLKRAIELQSGGESTSVKEETAERMTRSIMYVIGAALRSYPTPEIAIEHMLADSAEKLYYEGLHALNSLKGKADLLRLLLLRTKRPDQSDRYYMFTDITVLRYLEGYDPKFDAQSSVWVELPELGVCGNVRGLVDFYGLMRRLYEYNTGK